MTTLLLVLRKRKNKDGKQPLILQVTKDRKTSIIHLGIHLMESEWDKVSRKVKKAHPNAVRLNNYLIKKLSEASNESIELETHKPDISSKAVKQKIKREAGVTFFVQAQIYLDALKQTGKFNRYSADQPRIKHFREFLEGSDIVFSEINVGLLKRFQTWLKATRNVSERTIVNCLVVIRTIFNQAIASNIVDHKYYPFGKGKIVIRFPDSLKIGLVPEEVKAIEELELEKGSAINHARNVWLFSFYFAGMRVSDVLRLKWTDFQNDRLHYSMGKNDKGGSLKVPEKALKIIEQYKRENPVHDLVFPDLETLEDLDNLFDVQSRINQKLRKINESLQELAVLAKLSKKLTMHISRHTFGNISGDKIPIQMLQKLYRHSTIMTTIGYQANFILKDADEALDAVIGF